MLFGRIQVHFLREQTRDLQIACASGPNLERERISGNAKRGPVQTPLCAGIAGGAQIVS